MESDASACTTVQRNGVAVRFSVEENSGLQVGSAIRKLTRLHGKAGVRSLPLSRREFFGD